MRLTSGRLAWRRRRPERWWLGLAGAVCALVMAITVLRTGAAALLSTDGTGTVQQASARSYDILLTAPESAGGPGGEVNPAELGNASGGITLAQYRQIQRLPGVAVAAPLTMVGYLPFTASVPVTLALPTPVRATGPVTVTVRMQTDNGLSSFTWDDVLTAAPGGGSTGRPASLAVRLSWTFQLPLIAVDPAAEARLAHLDSAVTGGRYLPENAVPPTQAVPLLLAGSVADGDQAEVGLPGQAGQPAHAVTLTAAGAYRQLVATATAAPISIPEYWTAAPTRYRVAASGDLLPGSSAPDLLSAWGQGPSMWTAAPGAPGTSDASYGSVREHSGSDGGAAVRVVGVFDPVRVAGAPATPSPYRPALLTGADANSRSLLGGRPLAVPAGPGGLPGSAASLVMPLADLGALTSRYTGTSATAPIGAIRVLVAGARGDSAASAARVRSAAEEIVRATGLQADIALGAADVRRVIDLPAGLHGRPPLRLYQDWYLTGARATARRGPGPASLVVAGLGLAAGETVICWNAVQLVTWCRRELAALRALGRSRGELAARLAVDFVPVAVVSLGVMASAAWLAGHAIASGAGGAWLVLGLPSALTWLAVRPRRRSWSGSPARRIWSLLRATAHVPLRVLVVSVAAAALAVELAAHWALAGTASAWADHEPGWPVTDVDSLGVVLTAALAILMLAGLGRATRREGAADLRTLRALGWPARELDRLPLWQAAWPGLIGGLAAGTAVPLGLAASGGTQPALPGLPLAETGAAAVVFGLALSLLGAVIGASGQSLQMSGRDRSAKN